MRAAYYDKNGPAADVMQLGDVETPKPGPGEVRVKLAFSGLNPSDVKTRAGLTRKMVFPRVIPNSDGAGEIEAVGEGVRSLRAGDRVWIWNGAWKRPFGTSAEYIVLPEAQAVRLPKDISFEAGACLGIPALTAIHAVDIAEVAAGKTVLVAGGAGAVAHYAIQFAKARGALGPITILVNNAGQAESAPFAKTSHELWQRMLAVNLTGVFLCARQALPDMLAAGSGRIVNIASTAGQVGYPYVAAYTAAKHGVVGLTRSLAIEVARRGITVNAVCPGYTETDILHESIANVIEKTGRSAHEAREEFAKGNPQQRIIRPQEVADAVRWLCGDGASAITGQSISVSGGEVT